MVGNVVGAHKNKDVEELYETIRKMIAAVDLYETVVDHKRGDFHRMIYAFPRMQPNAEPRKKDESTDIDENKKALEELRTTIRNTLLTNLTVKREYVGAVVELYDELFKYVSPIIVTTNYDNVLETYCEQKTLDLANDSRSPIWATCERGTASGGGGARSISPRYTAV